MIFDEPIYNHIIRAILHHKRLRTKDLHQILQDDYGVTYSQSQLYKTIRRMLTSYILIKNRGEVCLNALWTEKVKSLSTSIAAYENTLWLVLPGENSEKRYYANSLKDLDIIWVEVHGKIVQDTQPRALYFYDSHPYFMLGSPDTEQEYTSFAARSAQIYWVIAHDTLLDRRALTHQEKNGAQCRMAPMIDLPHTGYYVAVLGPYILEVHMPEIIRAYCDAVFESVSSMDNFDAQAFQAIFTMKHQCFLTVKHNAAEAAQFVDRISDAWRKGEKL